MYPDRIGISRTAKDMSIIYAYVIQDIREDSYPSFLFLNLHMQQVLMM